MLPFSTRLYETAVFSEVGSGDNIVDPYTHQSGLTEEGTVLISSTPQSPPEATRVFNISIALFNDPKPDSPNWAHFAAAPSPNISFSMPDYAVMHSQDSLLSRILNGMGV